MGQENCAVRAVRKAKDNVAEMQRIWDFKKQLSTDYREFRTFHLEQAKVIFFVL